MYFEIRKPSTSAFTPPHLFIYLLVYFSCLQHSLFPCRLYFYFFLFLKKMTFEDIAVYQPGGGRIKNIQTQEHDSRAKWLAGLSTVGHRKQSRPLCCVTSSQLMFCIGLIYLGSSSIFKVTLYNLSVTKHGTITLWMAMSHFLPQGGV